ncbi:MAG: hypothetical protein WCI84_05395, partial [Bacteroidota bacterium]
SDQPHLQNPRQVIEAVQLGAADAINIGPSSWGFLDMARIAEPYIRRKAVRHLEKNRIVIFAAGTGNPYFTTDTAAVLRGIEIEADIIIKGTRVDGIYDSDPEKNPHAKQFTLINYDDVFKRNLKVMDMTAITLCKENKLPIGVFNMNITDNLLKLIVGENVGTKVMESAPSLS